MKQKKSSAGSFPDGLFRFYGKFVQRAGPRGEALARRARGSAAALVWGSAPNLRPGGSPTAQTRKQRNKLPVSLRK